MNNCFSFISFFFKFCGQYTVSKRAKEKLTKNVESVAGGDDDESLGGELVSGKASGPPGEELVALEEHDDGVAAVAAAGRLWRPHVRVQTVFASVRHSVHSRHLGRRPNQLRTPRLEAGRLNCPVPTLRTLRTLQKRTKLNLKCTS